jgi:hypothetical protein
VAAKQGPNVLLCVSSIDNMLDAIANTPSLKFLLACGLAAGRGRIFLLFLLVLLQSLFISLLLLALMLFSILFTAVMVVWHTLHTPEPCVSRTLCLSTRAPNVIV